MAIVYGLYSNGLAYRCERRKPPLHTVLGGSDSYCKNRSKNWVRNSETI